MCKFMNHVLWIGLAALGLAGSSWAQSPVYRCGNEYTNIAPTDASRGCQLLQGGNVTVIPGTRATAPAPAARTPSPPASAAASATVTSLARTSTAEQKARDADARLILEAELKKAQSRHAELLKDYNNGEPEKIGGEARNYQKYLDRVADMKASLLRNERDMESIRRELTRMAPASLAAATAGASAAK